jgi:hypothetical protein
MMEEEHNSGMDAIKSQATDRRKRLEKRGVTLNGVRYAGDAQTRQAIREAVDFADSIGMTAFDAWKDDGGRFHANHPVSAVRDALQAIASRRSRLIAREGEIHAACDAGTATQAMLGEGW